MGTRAVPSVIAQELTLNCHGNHAVCVDFKLMAAARSQLDSQPPETVGFILNKVQEDLARLKDEVSRSVGSGGVVDALAIKTALENTQKELQTHAETTLHLIQDRAATLPHIVQPVSRSKGTGGSSRRCAECVHVRVYVRTYVCSVALYGCTFKMLQCFCV